MLGNRLKSLRNITGKTQDDLATFLGITRGAYSHFENNRNEPDNNTLRKLADFFAVSSDYILGITDDPTAIRDVNQDLYDEHDYSKELEDFIKDNEISAAFQDYGSWTEEEKRNLLNFVKGQKALKELNKK